MRHALDYLVYLVVRLVVCVVQAIPAATCDRLARVGAVIAADMLRIRSRVVDDNLLHAFPELSPAERRELARGMWEHLILMGIEVVQAPRKIHDTNWREFVRLVNADQIILACFDERPLIMISGHYGNFELSGYVLALLGFPSFTVARPLDNPNLDRFINAFRARTGQYILAKKGSAHEVAGVLNAGGTLALLGDQYAGPKGCWVEFFGRKASSHKAVALFTLGGNAPAMFCFARREGRAMRHVMGADGILDPLTMPAHMRTVPAVTQWYTDRLERTIRQAPAQYWWLHRRWRDPRPRKKPRQAA
ncbi:MAG: lysophospholipid acyltransferase family protein [Pirellulales bacterium]